MRMNGLKSKSVSLLFMRSHGAGGSLPARLGGVLERRLGRGGIFKLQAQKTPFDRTLPQARRTLLFDGSMGESRSLTATAFVPNLG